MRGSTTGQGAPSDPLPSFSQVAFGSHSHFTASSAIHPHKRQAHDHRSVTLTNPACRPVSRPSDVDRDMENHLEEARALYRSQQMRRENLRGSTLSSYDKYREHYYVGTFYNDDERHDHSPFFNN